MKFHFSFLIVLITLLASCRKDRFYEGNNAVLTFSNDTLTFDTVFTSLGSVTRYFKVENPLKEAIRIDEIKLMGIPGNQFRINVDGIPGTSIFDVEIPANDYIYIFAEVTIDPNNQTNPFVLVDEIQYRYNQTTQSSYLRAWGQNAYFHYGEIIEGDSIWQNDKPHVVVRTDSFPGVGVEAFGSLTILPGCQVYFNQGSAIFSDGPVIIGEANCQDSVVLQSDRIEDLPNGLDFENTPGLWLGLILRSGASAELHNVIIKNSTYGIMGRWIYDDFASFNSSNQPIIELDKVEIKYSSNMALFCLNAQVEAQNCLFHNNGQSALTLAMGGQYLFDNCTFYGTGEQECVQLSNFASNGSQGAYGDLSLAQFTNCIVYGGKNDELLLNKESQFDFLYLFENCLLSTSLNTDTSTYISCIVNENPQFNNSNNADFSLSPNSVCVGAGKNNGIQSDLYCNPWLSPYDIGAISYQN
ncbi:MAG: hypothetical protein KDC82_06430 [Bacteroidetes bacterium]|nr:hypothetical protein [Bacteroidota bacterium]